MHLRAILLTVCALALGGCGEDQKSGNGTDRAFVAAMIPHHESAIEMADVARDRAESAFVRDLAAEIGVAQTGEIAKLQREDEQLERAGVEPGDLGVSEHAMGMHGDAGRLGTAEAFDKAFIEMMIPHHEGAIEMAEAELDKGGDPELRALAGEIKDAQQREIDAMKEHLAGGGEHSGH